MARNRKRAKERRARRPQPVGRPAREGGTARGIPAPPEPSELIGPLEHVAPDAELAEEQIELGAIEEEAGLDGEEARDEQAYEALAEDEAELEEEEARAATVAMREPRTPGNRVLTFLKGSWTELHRVQWPDRRQVVQATGVVIGFVIVAGLFLGLADLVSRHLVNYILYGHS